MARGKEGKCMCVCRKVKDSQDFNQNGLGAHGFGDYRRKFRVSSSSRSVIFFRVLENALVRTPRESRNNDWEVPARVFDVCATKVMDHINHVCVGIVFFHARQAKYQCFCALISGRLRKDRAN